MVSVYLFVCFRFRIFFIGGGGGGRGKKKGCWGGKKGGGEEGRRGGKSTSSLYADWLARRQSVTFFARARGEERKNSKVLVR